MTIEVNDEYSETLKISQESILKFAELSGDDNPIHIDKNYAIEQGFKTNIAHGILSASVFSRILGTKFPGNGSIYTFQELKFRKPIYAEELITVNMKVVSKIESKYTISTRLITSEGIALDGIAEVIYKKPLHNYQE